MLTGELRSKIDNVWNAFWAGGIANPLEVIEQITYSKAEDVPCRRLWDARSDDI